MGARERTAFALIPLVLGGVVLLPSWVYLGAIWLVTLLAAWELVALLLRHGHPVPRIPTLLAVAAALPALWLLGHRQSGWVLAALVVGLPLVHLLGRYPIAGASAGIAGAVFTATYFAVASGAMGYLRTTFADPLGWKVVLLHCISIWAGDSGAYYLGSRFGRHKMAPRVSPKKSWEGVAGGTIASFAGVFGCRAVFVPELPLVIAFVLAVLLAVLAPLGDLVESLFKRDTGVKDSSDLIPGHGGFLDRTDSLFFAAPFVLATLLLAGLGQ